MHLVELMDWLLDLFEKNPNYQYFHLDSQTIPLEDYLEIRPEKHDALKKYISEGRLLVGPWYTLPEMNTISGEAIVRNLLRGNKIASEFGRVMKIGYTPTSYGQISQIAQIYAGFGIDGMMFYRGISREECNTEYILEAPDGTQILGLRLSAEFSRASFWLHLARMTMYENSFYDGYYRWSIGQLPCRRCDMAASDLDYHLLKPTSLQYFNTNLLDEGLKRMKKDLGADATTPYLIAMDGMDSLFPHPNTVKVIDYCNEHHTDTVFIHSNFPEAIEKIKKAVKWDKLTVLKGERRHPSKDNWFNRFLKDNISTRLYQKQINAQMQTLLEKWAEPFSTFAYLLGENYPTPYLELAWKYLLSNHPHDSITGVSMDQIHEDMRFRWDQVRQIGESLTNKAFEALVKRINLSEIPVEDSAIIVFNPLNYARTEIIEIEVDFPNEPKNKSLEIYDALTQLPVEFQLQDRREWGTQVTNPYDISAPFFTRRFKLAFEATQVPACGYRTFVVHSKASELANYGSQLVNNWTMENEFLRVEINSNGTFNLLYKPTGKHYENCHFFEDDAEAGDPWSRTTLLQNQVISSRGCAAQIRLLEDGPLQTTFQIDIQMQIPKSLTADKRHRLQEFVTILVSSQITLRKGSPRLDIVTTFNNQAWDHRLRVGFPSGIQSKWVDAEVPYDVVRRSIEIPDTRNWVEPATGTQPHLSFVDVSDGKNGLALISHGLVEYEVQDNETRTMMLTLLKSVRYPKVGLPAERGERLDQIGSQCPGKHTSAYALYPHQGNWEEGHVFEYTYRHFTPLRAVQCGSSTGDLPLSLQLLKIEPEELILSALKKCEKRNSVILRLFNPTEKTISGRIKCQKLIKKARLVNLNEEPLQEIPVEPTGELSMPVGHKKIMTIELDF